MGTRLIVLNESYPMNTNMTRIRCFSKNLGFCVLDECSLSIGRVKKSSKLPSIYRNYLEITGM